MFEADKRFLNPQQHREKRELFIGLCAAKAAETAAITGKDIAGISLLFEADYSYTPHKVRLSLTNGKEHIVEGAFSYSPLVPPYDFLVNKSLGIDAPDINVFRLVLTDADVPLCFPRAHAGSYSSMLIIRACVVESFFSFGRYSDMLAVRIIKLVERYS